MLIIIGIVFLYSSVEALEDRSDLSFSISTAFSFMYGSINEYVFNDEIKASELKWDLKPLLLAGAKISCSFNSFKLEGSLFYGINDDTGSIRDYDWDTSTGEMTNFSQHNVKQRGSLFGDINIFYTYGINQDFSLLPRIGIKYNNIQLTAEDGYLEYPPGSPREGVYGKGIIYEQKYLIPNIGAGILYKVDPLSIDILFCYSHFTVCNARDSHVKRDIDYYDEINNAEYYYIRSEVLYDIDERISLSLNCGWTYIPLSKGSSYYIDLSTGEKSEVFENAGGIKTRYIEITLFINLRL